MRLYHCGLPAAAVLFAAAFAFAPLHPAQAQAWPTKPVRIIVNTSSGTGVDLLTRAFAPRLAATFGQPFVVENRVGAAGNIGLEAVTRSAPDGYTLLHAPGGPLVIGVHLYKLSFDVVNDLVPIVPTWHTPLSLVIRPGLPLRSVAELIAYARANPGKLNYGSSGSGSAVHLAAVMMAHAAKVQITHVPYKGVPQALLALLSGEIDFYFDPGPANQYIKSGKVLLLAVAAAAARSPFFPDTPTMAEAGTAVDMDIATGMFARAGTPREIVTQLNREVARILKTAEITTLLTGLGGRAMFASPEEFAAKLKSERERFGAIVREANIRAD